MDRRRFVGICGAGLAALQMRGLAAQDHNNSQEYARVKLVLPSGETLHPARLKPNLAYVFHYPYVGTPCFLIRLDLPIAKTSGLKTADGSTYTGIGGAGPDQSIVAFTAICPHQLSYLGKDRSFINYRADKSTVAKRNQVIVCCAHHSVYDPKAGGRVVSGPAPQSLTSILLNYEKSEDALFATGTLGSELFTAYFRAFKIDLIKAFGRGKAKQRVTGHAVVLEADKYCARQVRC